MADSPLEKMIMANVVCTICGARPGACDCWTQCKCGWSFRKGTSCRNPECGGDGVLEPMLSK